MADLNPWLIAALALILGLIPCAWVIGRKGLADGLAALQLAGIITTMAALLLAAGFHRPTVADIPMALAVLSCPSGLLFAHFLERLAMSGVATLGSIVALSTAVGLVWVCIVGMIRARDAFGRLHFPGAAVLVGPPAAAVALGLSEGLSPTGARAWLIVAVLLLTNGILAHAIARAEWLRRRSEEGMRDEARGGEDGDP